MRGYRRLFLIAAIVFVFGVTGCASTSPAGRYYTLSALSDRAVEDAPAPAVSLLVGPVRLPAHLDRPQLVARDGANRLVFDEFHRWAGSLQDDISRVLADNLSVLLGTDRVALYPSRGLFSDGYQVELELSRFEPDPEGVLQLRARWSLFGDQGQRLLERGAVRYSEPVAAEGFEAVVASQSQILDLLSRELAEAVIRSVESRKLTGNPVSNH